MSNTLTDLGTVTNIRSTSRICVTYFNISWDAPSITCGDVYYEVSISPPPIEGDAVVTTVDRFLSVTGLNNSLPDVTITVTAVDRVGQKNGSIFVQLLRSLGKCSTHNYTSSSLHHSLMMSSYLPCNVCSVVVPYT